MLSPFIQRRITAATLICMACALGVFLFTLFTSHGPYIFTLSLGLVFLIVWTLSAGPRWWLPMPAAVTFGGLFYFGFKIYLHEMALPLCVLALLPTVALRRAGNKAHRKPLPFAVWLFLGYFILEWLVSLFVLKIQGTGGSGSMSRIYFQALWPLIFLILFDSFGDSRFLRTALILMYAACLLRILVAFIAFFSTSLLRLPILNFVFSSSTGGIIDFRFSGIQLLLLSLCFAQLSRTKIIKALFLTMTFIAAGLIFLGGGRVSVGILFAIPVFWAFLFRRLAALSIISLALLVAVLYLNQKPQLIYLFPPTVQRALSILVRDSPTSSVDWHRDLLVSNEWHRRLAELGRERWLSSPVTFLFGERAKPFDDSFAALEASMETKAQVAASMGLYESGLWNVLGLTGICGILIYSTVFWYLLKDVARMLWLEEMSSYVHAIGFIAVAEITLWVVFAWIAGSFPSQELLMAVLARFAWEDSRQKTESMPVPEPSFSAQRSARISL